MVGGQSSPHWLLLAANILVGERSLAFAMMTTGSQLFCLCCDFFIISSANSALRAGFRTIRANPSLFCLTHHFSPFCPSPPPFPPHFALPGAFSCGSPKTRLEEGTPVPTIPPVARIILSNCRGPPPLCTYNHLLFISVLKMLRLPKFHPGQGYKDLSMNFYD